MTAKSRVRKIQKRMRRNTDVNPYPGSNRTPSDSEQEDRNDGEGRAVAIAIDGKARIQSVSLVREGEGTGYILEVGGEAWDRGIAFKHATSQLVEEFLYGGQEPTDIQRDYADRALAAWNKDHGEEAVRTAPAPDAAPLADRGASEAEGQPAAGIDWDIDRNQPARIPTHQVFFEQEVNGQPTHIESDDCYCGLDSHHWKDLGEI